MSAAPEQQPPRAVDVPEAVLAAIHRYQAAVIDAVLRFGKGPAMREFVAAESALEAAIATALREAREQGAADTARLAELVAAADDILPDDWDTRRCPKFTRLWLAIGEMQNAARAAEPEGSDA